MRGIQSLDARSYRNRLAGPHRIRALFLLAWAKPAAAQSIGMAVELPLGGTDRAGSWIPLSCALTNQGPSAEVTLEAQVQETGPNPADRPAP